MRSTYENNDSLQAYLDQMGRFPRLTAAEESAAADRLVDARRRLRTCLLSSDFVLEKAARLLERLQQRELRLDHTIGFSTNDAAERQRVTALLPTVVERLRTVLRDNRRDFAQLMRRGLPVEERRAAWRRMAARRRTVGSAVDQIGIRTRHLQRWEQQLESLAMEVESLRRRVTPVQTSGPDAVTPDARTKEERRRLHALLRETGQLPATLGRQIESCRRHEREYEEIKQHIVSSNLRLVVALAKRYRRRGVGFLDLIQEGNASLLQAVDRWDPKRGKFATYATWWARQAMKQAVRLQPRTIRLPEQVVERLRRIQGAARSLVQQHGFHPDVETLASKAGMSTEQAERMLRVHREPFSLDQPFDENSEAAMGELIVDPRASAFAEDFSREQLKSRLADVLTELNERQRTVISLRFGLLDGSQRTLDEVGKLMSLTREGVRQIELRAVERLRHPTRSRLLRGFLDTDEIHTMNRG
ncbi:MAG TPA: sigma-70 family RNA polymerase sigma factor [Pirellulales bacterium]|nr:sigma-70 family RNA polymerase sigma factor [Pirellulales bacterium]